MRSTQPRRYLSSHAIAFRLLMALSSIVVIVAGCSSENRHRVVVYDQDWSAARGKTNIRCSPELRASCDKEALEGAAKLPETLSAEFRATPECSTVQLFVMAGEDKSSQELQKSLNENDWKLGQGYRYWRLRVDYHPELPKQPFSIGHGNGKGSGGGDDVENDAAFICELVKHNGVEFWW